jgi:hypothetical protein
MTSSGPGRIVGNSRIREIQAEARGEWLREGAQFSTEMQKLPAIFRFPRGVFRYKTHEEANQHWFEAVVDSIVATQEKRRGR